MSQRCEEMLHPVIPVSPAPEGGEAVPGRRALPGSTAFVPAAAGLMLAGRVVRRLAGLE